MAMATFSLFPSPSVKSGQSGQKNDLRYLSRLAKEPDFEMVKMSDSTHGIVIAVEETPASTLAATAPIDARDRDQTTSTAVVPSITLSSPQAHFGKGPSNLNDRPRTPSPIRTNEDVSEQQGSRSASPTATRSPDSPERSRAPSPLQQERSPKSQAGSPTLVRKRSNASTRTATHSPIMRSMFPRYDPQKPLARQRYYPQVQQGRSSPALEEPSQSPSLYLQQSRQATRLALPVLDIPQAPPGAMPILQQVSHAPNPSALSTPEELLQLWSIANGQAAVEAADIHTIELSCDSLTPNEEIITFSSTSQALYTLSISHTGISISRTHPLSPQPTIQISETVLSTPSTTSPLVASIFPKLAELMALDQSSSIAVSHRLDRQASSDLQSEAVSRAQQNEAASLMWDSDSGRYFLIHPTLLDNTSTSFPIDITPSALDPERIVISAPETDGATPLLTLTLPSRTLTINTMALSALPSLYTLDTLLSALLCLLLHLHRSSSTPALAEIPRPSIIAPSFPPPPSLRSSSQRPSRNKGRTFSTWYKSSQQPQDEEAGIMTARTAAPSRSRDVESEWGYKPMINVEDENLPAPTRAVLRTLYWGFEVLIWVLGLVINLLAMGVVGAGKVVKKL